MKEGRVTTGTFHTNLDGTDRLTKRRPELEEAVGVCSPKLGQPHHMIGFWARLSYAFRCFFAILSSAEIPQDIASALIKRVAETTAATGTAAPMATPPSKTVDTPVAESVDRAVQMLGLLQRDGRLIDFLVEDVTPFPDAQLGAAVRSIHTSCRQVLERYVELSPVIDSDEDQPVTVPAGFDPAAIKLVGNVAGKPPLRGVLRHRGWRVKKVTLPSLPQGSTGRAIVAPAEVEIL